MNQKGVIHLNTKTETIEDNLKILKTLTLPEDVDGLVRLRLRDLTDRELEILQVAACIGTRVTK